VILGENGAGKSTLLRTLAGLIRPTLGTVRVFGSDPQEQRHRIGYMSHAPMLYDELTALENLRYYAALYAGTTGDSCGCAVQPESALRSVGLDPSLARPISAYSQGMRQRASLARVLLSEPELLLLDEPFSNMDAASARQMTALLREMQMHSATGRPRTILLTTHQPELARPIANCYLTMHRGQIVSQQESTEFPA
jgi:ABC-type multidrug transport system ATPase subunit